MADTEIMNETALKLTMNDAYAVGVDDYEELSNKPKINNVEVSGNKSLDDYGIESKDDAAETMSNISFTSRANDKVVVFSDSTFQTNHDVNNGNKTQKSVVDFMKELAPNISIDNRGVGGTDSDWLLNLLNGMSTDAISDATYVIVAYGTNDWQESRDLFKVNKIQTNTMNFVYGACLDKIQELAPHANVICVTPAFLKSTSSSKWATLNVNNTGNTIHAYADVIEFEANRRNIATLRLDYLMGINMSNYKSRMVASTADIWVHYNEDTNRRIATMLLNCIYGISVPSATSKCIDMTPESWFEKTSKNSYYNFGSLSKQTTNIHAAQGLLPAQEYWVTLIGGNAAFTNNGEQVAHSVGHQSFMQFPIMSDSSGNISLKQTLPEGDYAFGIYNMRLTLGRPNIFDGVRENSLHSVSYYTDNQMANLFGSALYIGFKIYSFSEDIAIDTKIGDLPDELKDFRSDRVFAFGQITGSTTSTTDFTFVGRGYNGGLYSNSAHPKKGTSDMVISCILIGVGN